MKTAVSERGSIDVGGGRKFVWAMESSGPASSKQETKEGITDEQQDILIGSVRFILQRWACDMREYSPDCCQRQAINTYDMNICLARPLFHSITNVNNP